jgi:hypothetical protein
MIILSGNITKIPALNQWLKGSANDAVAILGYRSSA